MRILVLSDHYPPHLTGGYDIACEAITEGLRRRQHDVLVITSNFGKSRREAPSHVDRVLHRPQDSASLVELGWWEWHDHHAIAKRVREFRPDVVSVWKLHQLFPSVHLLLRGLTVPIVFNLHDLWLPRHCDESSALASAWNTAGSGWVKRAVKRPLRATLRRANAHVTRPVRLDDIPLDHVVFCSRFREAQHVSAGLGGADRRVIYNGVDVARFAPATRPPTGPLKLLFAGRLVEEKGLHTVIESLALLRGMGGGSVTLTMVAIPSYPHDYRTRIERLIATSGAASQITIRPPEPAEAMPGVYRDHDVLVFPSVGPEGFPMTVLEAASCGLAIVATTTGGTGEFVRAHETGLTFAPNDAAALADCLAGLTANRALVHTLGSSARQLAVSEFDIETIVDQWDAYLQTMSRTPVRRIA